MVYNKHSNFHFHDTGPGVMNHGPTHQMFCLQIVGFPYLPSIVFFYTYSQSHGWARVSKGAPSGLGLGCQGWAMDNTKSLAHYGIRVGGRGWQASHSLRTLWWIDLQVSSQVTILPWTLTKWNVTDKHIQNEVGTPPFTHKIKTKSLRTIDDRWSCFSGGLFKRAIAPGLKIKQKKIMGPKSMLQKSKDFFCSL